MKGSTIFFTWNQNYSRRVWCETRSWGFL